MEFIPFVFAMGVGLHAIYVRIFDWNDTDWIECK